MYIFTYEFIVVDYKVIHWSLFQQRRDTMVKMTVFFFLFFYLLFLFIFLSIYLFYLFIYLFFFWGVGGHYDTDEPMKTEFFSIYLFI